MKNLLATVVVIGLSPVLHAAVITVPLKTGDYAWVYQGGGGTMANVNMTTAYGGAFASILPVAETGVWHDVRSYLRFDLTDLTWHPGDKAELVLHSSANNFGFGTLPSGDGPVTVGICPVTSAWTTSSISWNNQPIADNPAAIVTVDGVEKTYLIDVSALVASWTAIPATNHGIELERTLIRDETADNLLPAFSATGTNAPTLRITSTPVPEPTVTTWLCLTLPALAKRRK